MKKAEYTPGPEPAFLPREAGCVRKRRRGRGARPARLLILCALLLSLTAGLFPAAQAEAAGVRSAELAFLFGGKEDSKKLKERVAYAEGLEAEQLVYLDLVSVQPYYSITITYNQYGAGSTFSEPNTLVCQCVTEDGLTAWIVFSTSEYKRDIDSRVNLRPGYTLFGVDGRNYTVPHRLLGQMVSAYGVHKELPERTGSTLVVRYSALELSEAAIEEDTQTEIRYYYDRGLKFFRGDGLTQDYELAVANYRKAAELGGAEAQNELGYCYETGQGVEQDYEQAAEWYRKAAEQEHAIAQCNLGLCYEFSRGVEQDYEQAVEWYRKAAEQGYAKAQYRIGLCFEDGNGVEQDTKQAAEWYRKAAEQGYAYAQHNLGWCYEKGQGVEQDYLQAVEWYRKAAEQDYAASQCNLGWCYENGNGVEQDYEQAAVWYTTAAGNGDAAAQNNLGLAFYYGRGVEKDLTQAAAWFLKSAEQGYVYAQNNIGYCYEEGIGVEQDTAKAIEWYTLAAEQGHEGAAEALKNLQP